MIPFTEKYGSWLVVGLSAILFVPLLGSVHLFDWDEINFAESAREMLITGEYFKVQINFQPFWEKPPLFFWMQVLSMKLFGVTEFAARFPNAVCGIVTLVFVFNIGKKYFNSTFAWFWVLFMIGSFTPFFYFKSGIIDPWFNLFIFAALFQIFLASNLETRKGRMLRFFYCGLFCGLAFLTKGPVSVLIVGLCMTVSICLNRFRFFFGWREALVGLTTFLMLGSVWVLPEVSAHGVSVLTEFMNYQIDLFLNPVAGHGQPFWYHAVILLLGCFPASFFALRQVVRRGNSGGESQTRLTQWMQILFWVVLILFSLVTTKIIHYSSLCYLPLAFLAARGVQLHCNAGTIPKWPFILFVGVFGTLFSLAFMFLTLIGIVKDSIIPYLKDDFAVSCLNIASPLGRWEWILGVIYLLALMLSLILLYRKKNMAILAGFLGFSGLFITIYMAVVAPKVEQYSQGPAIAFYSRFAGKDVYIESLGYKSYAQYFYGQTQPGGHPDRAKTQWLLHGDPDRPIFLVVKSNQFADYRNEALEIIDRKGGFVLVKRIVNP